MSFEAQHDTVNSMKCCCKLDQPLDLAIPVPILHQRLFKQHSKWALVSCRSSPSVANLRTCRHEQVTTSHGERTISHFQGSSTEPPQQNNLRFFIPCLDAGRSVGCEVVCVCGLKQCERRTMDVDQCRMSVRSAQEMPSRLAV